MGISKQSIKNSTSLEIPKQELKVKVIKTTFKSDERIK